MTAAYAYRGKRPVIENDQAHWVTDEEFRVAEFVVIEAIQIHDRALEPSTPDFIEVLLGTLSAAFPLPKGTEHDIALKVQVYVDALRDFPPDLLATAARRALRRCKFFPTIAELIGGGEDEGVESRHFERIYARNRLSRSLGLPSLPAPGHRDPADTGAPWPC